MISDDRRAFKRVKKKFTVRHRELSPSATGASGTAVSENISPGGVYFVSLERLPVGQMLECRINMPLSSAEGRWTARVVRCQNLSSGMVPTFGVAVEFIESFGDSEKLLRKNLKSL
jgi:hypothetical protein